MKDGYIIIPRAVLDDDYFADRFTRAQAFIDLYFLAAYKERTFFIRGNRVVVKRGQVAVSLRDLAARWQWSKNTVAKFINELESVGKIGTHRSRIINIITLKNYKCNDPQNDPQNDPPYNKEKIKNNYYLKENYKKIKENADHRPSNEAADQQRQLDEIIKQSRRR